jgi:hypothetical protein
MKTKWIITALIALLATANVYAQTVSKDSINMLKQQKEALKIAKSVNEQKLKLADLENSVEKKTLDMQNTARRAQESANNNAKAADQLTSNPQSEGLANKAGDKAGDAKKDAKKARKAEDDLNKTRDKIEKLKKKIADDEAKLSSLRSTFAPGN